MSLEDVVGMVVRIINGEVDGPEPGEVDWSEVIIRWD